MNDRIEYAAFVISHGRPNDQKTYDFLKKKGCPNVYIVCDDLDRTLVEYKKNYGEQVLVFDKKKYMREIDTFYNVPVEGHPVYARNAVYDLAMQCGYRYFVVFDDDLKNISLRTKRASSKIKNIDDVFQAVFRFLVNTPIYQFGTVGLRHFIGGYKDDLFWEAVHISFCDTQRRVYYYSHYFEDAVSPAIFNKTGRIICGTCNLQASFIDDGSNAGGIENHTKAQRYLYSFGALMGAPTTIKVLYSGKNKSWETYKKNQDHPLIVHEKWRKQR